MNATNEMLKDCQHGFISVSCERCQAEHDSPEEQLSNPHAVEDCTLCTYRRDMDRPNPNWRVAESQNEGVGLLIEADDIDGDNPSIIIAELDNTPRMRANSRLMAYAPDMLQILRTLIAFENGDTEETLDNIIDAARDAIFKVKGDL